jgi:exopolyphosphatase/guanosine-5'-triphosphate,3'-diphosphate pyrophosphatase
VTERRTAVIDLGSNSFRLVVFTAGPGWWRRTDEIYEPVRLGEGQADHGPLQPAPTARALRTIEVFAHFCQATGLPPADVHPVATSAIRDAANRDELLAAAEAASGLRVRVLSAEDEALLGYVAAINSSTLADGLVLDLGGGSLQLTRVRDRRPVASGSWPLGAVRMTEAFLPGERAGRKQVRALREHVARALRDAPWPEGGAPRMVGLGGTVRNLAAAAQLAAGLPSFGVQGFALERPALDALVDELAARPAAKRGAVPGIKPERADLILAGALVVQAVMEQAGAPALEVTEHGLREGVFLAAHLAPADPPLVPDVRAASVRNLAAVYDNLTAHSEHVARLALSMWDALAGAGLHAGVPEERELLWAAAMLHDIGVTVDYDDHHKHSRYLILNAGLPGFSPREVALVAQMARYHRKGAPALGLAAPLARPGDEALLRRGAALLRVAEQLERARDQLVRDARVEVQDGAVRLALVGDGEVGLARWGAQGQAGVFAEAFGRRLEVA